MADDSGDFNNELAEIDKSLGANMKKVETVCSSPTSSASNASNSTDKPYNDVQELSQVSEMISLTKSSHILEIFGGNIREPQHHIKTTPTTSRSQSPKTVIAPPPITSDVQIFSPPPQPQSLLSFIHPKQIPRNDNTMHTSKSKYLSSAEISKIAENQMVLAFNEKINNLENDNVLLVEEMERLVSFKEEEVVECKKRFEEELRKTRSDLRESHDKYTRLMEKIGKLDDAESQSEALKTVVVELEKRLEFQIAENALVRTDLNNSKSEVHKLRIDVAHLKSNVEAILNENNALKADLLKLVTEAEQGQTFSETRLKESEAERRKMEEQVKTLNYEMNDKNMQINRLHDELMNSERRVTQFDSDSVTLRRRISDFETLEREYNRARRHISNIESEIHYLSKENLTLKETYSTNGRSNGIDMNKQWPEFSSLQQNYSGYAPLITSNNYTKSIPLNINQRDEDKSGLQATLTGRSTSPLRDFLNRDSTSQKENKMTSSSTVATSTASTVTSASNVSLRSLSTDNPMVNAPSASNPGKVISVHAKQQVKSGVDEVFSGASIAPLTHLSNQIQYSNRAFRTSLSGTPYGTEDTAIMQSKFDDLEKNLTSLMTEKTSLMEESEKLHQRGGKTLKERTRLTQVELRLKELGKDISNIRKELTKAS